MRDRCVAAYARRAAAFAAEDAFQKALGVEGPVDRDAFERELAGL